MSPTRRHNERKPFIHTRSLTDPVTLLSSSETYQQRHEIGTRRSSTNIVTYNLNTAFSTDLCTRKSLISPSVESDSTRKEESRKLPLKQESQSKDSPPLRASSRHASADAKAKMQAILLAYSSPTTWKLSASSSSVNHKSVKSEVNHIQNDHKPVQTTSHSVRSIVETDKGICCSKDSCPSTSKCSDEANCESNAVLEACLSLLCDRTLAHNLRHHHPCLKEVASAMKSLENTSPEESEKSSPFHASPYNCKIRRQSSSEDLWEWMGPPNDNFVMLPDDVAVLKRCYCAMRHQEDGLIIRVHDCVLVHSGFREKPFVAKITALYQENNEKMMTLLWYYRPEHAPQGRYGSTQYIEQEVFASRHRDYCSVTCIENKAYVLPLRAFARYSAELCRRSQHRSGGIGSVNHNSLLPLPPLGQFDSAISCGLTEECDTSSCHSLTDKFATSEFPEDISTSNVLLCRAIFDVKLRKVIMHPELNHLMPDMYNTVQQLQVLHQQHRRPPQLSALTPFYHGNMSDQYHHHPIIERTTTLRVTTIKQEPVKNESTVASLNCHNYGGSSNSATSHNLCVLNDCTPVKSDNPSINKTNRKRKSQVVTTHESALNLHESTELSTSVEQHLQYMIPPVNSFSLSANSSLLERWGLKQHSMDDSPVLNKMEVKSESKSQIKRQKISRR